MLHVVPRHLPGFRQTVAALPGAPADIAQALGASERSIWRWLAADEAPRPAHLALWWLTPAGWSLVVSEAEHRVRVAEQLTEALRRDLDEERAQCARLLRMGYGGGSANAPLLRAVGR